MAQVGIPQSSLSIGRFGARVPNTSTPSGSNQVDSSDVETPWYASGPVWVLVFLIVGYVLVFQTLKG
jgi:hypothetical protein